MEESKFEAMKEDVNIAEGYLAASAHARNNPAKT